MQIDSLALIKLSDKNFYSKKFEFIFTFGSEHIRFRIKNCPFIPRVVAFMKTFESNSGCKIIS